MGKCIKNIALSVMAAIFGALALSGPVFATPATNTENPTADTTVVTPVDAPANPTDAPADTTPTDDTTEETTDESQTCYDQVGNLGWLVCPGVGLLSKVIDGAYGLLTQVIQVNPIPTDHESPYYVVWEYFKNITNLMFVVFFLIVIFSQLTGVGINNYGIKKVLPRIIITAILVNLSYIVCTIAVDISNILGNSLHGFFMHVQDIAVQNGTISAEAKSTSVAAITYAILGIGAAGAAGTALVFAGSIEGLLWMLAPVLLSGVIAVLSALIIMAARQALIYLLVMISPLAFIAYMLPNTESWFTKWYKLFARMILFYPMFSVLYGASQLAGLVIIASSDNPFMKVLGIAVEVVPLFMSIPLMKMSGTALNKIDGIFNRMTSPLTGAAAGYAASQSALAKQKALSKQNPVAPHTRLAQYLDKRRARRESDTAYLNTLRNENNQRYAEDTMYSGKGDNKYLNRRGRARYENELRRIDNANAHKEWLADLDEGFEDDDKRIRTSNRAWVSKVNKGYVSAVDRDKMLSARQSDITLTNERKRAERLRSALGEHAEKDYELNDDDKRIRQEVGKIFRMEDKGQSFYDALDKERAGLNMTEDERKKNGLALSTAEKGILRAHRRSLNAVLADSISAKRKADATDKSTYLELYADTPAGPSNEHSLENAIDAGDYNSMSAAIEIMGQRGDYGDIQRVIRENSGKLQGDENLYMQKVLNDTLIKMKADDPRLWAYAKGNMIRRAIASKGGEMEGFISFEEFLRNQKVGADSDDNFAKVSYVNILNNLKDGKIFAGADRTSFKGMLESIEAGVIPTVTDENGNTKTVILPEPVKYARMSLCGGMDGEALDSYNNLFVLGSKFKYGTNADGSVNLEETLKSIHALKKDGTEKNAAFLAHQAEVSKNLNDYFRDMSTGQLASTKTATLVRFNDTMNALAILKAQEEAEKNGTTVNLDDIFVTKTVEGLGTIRLNKSLVATLGDKISELNRNTMSGTRANMNPAVCQLLGIDGKTPPKTK